jgi:hypothetical protein
MSRLKHPVRAIREPFGKAGLTVAVCALLLALVGGAYAAGGLTKAQEKQVTKIAKKYAGKPGATGTNGTNGTNGKDGTAGTNGKDGAPGEKGDPGEKGAKGANGKSAEVGTPTGAECPNGGATVQVAGEAASKQKVCNGTNGVTGFTDTLPSGKTETGTWAIGASTAGFLQDFTSISFSIPLASAGGPNSAIAFNLADTEAEKFGKKAGLSCKVEVGEPLCIDTGCEGTALEPTAPSGKLCIYTAREELDEGTSSHFVAITTKPGSVAEYGVSGSMLEGPFLEGSAEEPAAISAFGTWAVTAPAGP